MSEQYLNRPLPYGVLRLPSLPKHLIISSHNPFSQDTKEHLVMVHQDEFVIETRGHQDMNDITDQVRHVVVDASVNRGIAHVFNVGSTGAIGTIEYEPGLIKDLPNILDKLMPPSRSYGHEHAWHDGNTHSHLQATTLGPALTIPVRNACLVLGTWQQIFHLECDINTRRRTVVVTVMGE